MKISLDLGDPHALGVPSLILVAENEREAENIRNLFPRIEKAATWIVLFSEDEKKLATLKIHI